MANIVQSTLFEEYTKIASLIEFFPLFLNNKHIFRNHAETGWRGVLTKKSVREAK